MSTVPQNPGPYILTVPTSAPSNEPLPAKDLWQTRVLPVLRTVAEGAWSYLLKANTLPVLRKKPRRLRVRETVSLGDKRSVSILEVDGQSFLLASSGTSITLLASMTEPAPASFQRMLCDSYDQGEVQ